MRKVIHKWFWAWEAEKEEKWLNEMCAKGLGLTSVGFARYEFEDCTPGEYQYRLEFLEHLPTHPESVQYIKFVEDTGAEQIGSITRWVYFRKKTADGPFDLFSDNASRIKHLSRIIALLLTLNIFNIYIGCYNIFLAIALDSPINYCGIINLIIGALLFYGIFKLNRQRKALKKEQQIFE